MDNLEQKIANYKPPNKVKQILDQSKTIFLVGITGAGKDTVMNELLKNSYYHQIISHTTRAPRANHGVMEINGADYHFIDQHEAQRMLENNEFVEAKFAHGNVYGTSIAELEKAHSGGSIAIADIEVQGVAEYCALSSNVIPIFLLPPSFDVWMGRLSSRYKDQMDNTELTKRLNTAKAELKEALGKSYFEYVVNDDLALTVKITNEVAHGSFSKKKNAESKKLAQKLLEDLNSHLG